VETQSDLYEGGKKGEGAQEVGENWRGKNKLEIGKTRNG